MKKNEKIVVLTDAEGKKIVGTETAINGYTKSKVEHAIEWLETHKSIRNISVEDVIEEYNYLKGTNITSVGCKSCSLNKYYMGIQNFASMGERTLRVMGKWEETVDEPTKELIEAVAEVKDETAESPAEEKETEGEVKLTRAEILAKARAAKKTAKKNDKDNT